MAGRGSESGLLLSVLRLGRGKEGRTLLMLLGSWPGRRW